MERKDAKYGVPVATRVDADLAYELGKRAEKVGMTLSAYVAMFLGRATKETSAEDELRQEKEYNRLAVGKFIVEIGKTADDRKKLVELFNKISSDVRATKDLFRS